MIFEANHRTQHRKEQRNLPIQGAEKKVYIEKNRKKKVRKIAAMIGLF